MKSAERILQGARTALINEEISSIPQYRLSFVSNEPARKAKVLSVIEKELLSCLSFQISVAFITSSGLTPLLSVFQELERKGVQGRILTTDYLNFSEPSALARLDQMPNIELRMYSSAEEGFHTKGYFFEQEDHETLIVGSSNLTASALTINKEWNTRIVLKQDGEYSRSIHHEFETLWNSAKTRPYREVAAEYDVQYRLTREQQRIALESVRPQAKNLLLKPNPMQVRFTKNLEHLIKNGARKALLISATGTGKTYASAFALREQKPKRALFLVHREQIARKAMESFEQVMGEQYSYGLLSGSHKDLNADLLFSTVQSMSRDDQLHQFARDAFDVIIIDEVHRAGATSYQKIMDYFEPKLFLGMTASPERTDGYDLFSLFDHNVAYEIRLQQAMEENMLVPFHYFGLSDLDFDLQDSEAVPLGGFNQGQIQDQARLMMQQADYYGYSGSRVKGLIFVSTNQEARELSRALNKMGRRTLALSGDSSQEEREKAIERLTQERDDYLEYIISVDIFNEGIDIPEINQVILARPTKSPVVFVQQLGRGLRKAKGKEYTIVLDFIKNYDTNYLIPMALSGDRSWNKDNERHSVLESNTLLPGISSVHFDAISRKRILDSIDRANFSEARLLKNGYMDLKNRLGRIPRLLEFDENYALDPLRIFDSKTYGSYYAFLCKNDRDYQERLDPLQAQMLEFISRRYADGKRVHELALLKEWAEFENLTFEQAVDSVRRRYDITFSDFCRENIRNQFLQIYPAGSQAANLQKIPFAKETESGLVISDLYRDALHNPAFRDQLLQTLDFGISRWEAKYRHPVQGTDLVLNEKYTYDDVFRLLNWPKQMVSLNVGGYILDKTTKSYPVFINYEKGEDIQETIMYEDRLLSPNLLQAISKGKRKLDSEEIQNILHADELGYDMQLFIRKNKNDANSKEFYYLGRIHPEKEGEEITMKDGKTRAVRLHYHLETPVREDLYDYFLS